MEVKGARVVESHWSKVNKHGSDAALETFKMYKKCTLRLCPKKLYCFWLLKTINDLC